MPADLVSMSKLAASCVVSSAWEGTILVTSVALLLSFLRGMSAAARFVVWSSLAVVLVAMPFLSIMRSQPSSSLVPAEHVLRMPIAAAWGFCVVWAVMSLYRVVQLLRSGIHVLRISREALPLHAEQRMMFALPSETLDRMYTSALVDVPCVGGFLQPRILLPEMLLELMSREELVQIVQHEQEHLRRRDPWLNLMQKICVALFPLNPALWWTERRLCAERELACDDRVVAEAAKPKEYALSLTNLAEFSIRKRTVSLMLGAWRKRSELSVRVHRILSSQKPWRGAATAGVAAMLTVGIAGAGIFLGRTPSIVGYADAAPAQQQAAVRVSVATNVLPPVLKSVSLPKNVAKAQSVHAVKTRKATAAPATQPVLSEPLVSAEDVALATDSKVEEKLPHVQPVLLEDARHKYAAFRLADGWLLIQL